jgi:hypothetical protein
MDKHKEMKRGETSPEPQLLWPTYARAGPRQEAQSVRPSFTGVRSSCYFWGVACSNLRSRCRILHNYVHSGRNSPISPWVAALTVGIKTAASLTGYESAVTRAYLPHQTNSSREAEKNICSSSPAPDSSGSTSLSRKRPGKVACGPGRKPESVRRCPPRSAAFTGLHIGGNGI